MLIRRGDESFRALAAALRDGRVVAAACDTIYGFLGIVPDSEADIRRIKGRGETKPFPHRIRENHRRPGAGRPPAAQSYRPGGFAAFLHQRKPGRRVPHG